MDEFLEQRLNELRETRERVKKGGGEKKIEKPKLRNARKITSLFIGVPNLQIWEAKCVTPKSKDLGLQPKRETYY